MKSRIQQIASLALVQLIFAVLHQLTQNRYVYNRVRMNLNNKIAARTNLAETVFSCKENGLGIKWFYIYPSVFYMYMIYFKLCKYFH